MGYIKVFSGSEILALALQAKIEEVGVKTLVKNNIQTSLNSGIGHLGQAVEVFIQEVDFGKASPVLEDFRMSL